MKPRKKGMIFAALLLLFVAALLMVGSTVPFAKTCDSLRPKVLRLHVIGADNSALAQSQKLAVRDALLANSDLWLDQAHTKQEAIAALQAHLSQVKEAADAALLAAGSSDTVCVSIAKSWFPTKSYEDGTTLPAGEYDALQVKVGKAQGRNWWCMLFPDLCIPAAGDQGKSATGSESTTEDGQQGQVDRTTIFTPDELEITKDGSKYQVKLFVVEVWEWLKDQCSAQ